MSQTMSQKENQVIKQSKSSSPKIQHPVTINPTASQKLTNERKHRSSLLSNGIDQIVGFIQRKFSQSHDEEKQEFDDLTKIK